VLRYLIFVRPVECLFANETWGERVSKFLRRNFFYRTGGEPYTESAQFSQQVLAPATLKYLGSKITGSEWRQLCTGLGREFGASLIDPGPSDTGMDLLAGRSTAVSVHNYAISTDTPYPHLTPERLRVYFLNSKLWWARAYGLKVDGPLIALKDLENPKFDPMRMTNDENTGDDRGERQTSNDERFKREVTEEIVAQISKKIGLQLEGIVSRVVGLIKDEAVKSSMDRYRTVSGCTKRDESFKELTNRTAGKDRFVERQRAGTRRPVDACDPTYEYRGGDGIDVQYTGGQPDVRDHMLIVTHAGRLDALPDQE